MDKLSLTPLVYWILFIGILLVWFVYTILASSGRYYDEKLKDVNAGLPDMTGRIYANCSKCGKNFDMNYDLYKSVMENHDVLICPECKSIT